MRITRPCLIIRDFGTHKTPRVLHFGALVITDQISLTELISVLCFYVYTIKPNLSVYVYSQNPKKQAFVLILMQHQQI